MWQALRDIVDNAKQSLGIEVPAVPDTSQRPTSPPRPRRDAAGAATDAADGAAEAVTVAGEAATGVGEQISSKVSDFLGRFGG